MSGIESVRRGAVALSPSLLLALGIAPVSAQAPQETQVQPETDAPAADASGWSDIGTWGIIVLIVIVAIIVWFVWKRPRAR